jgi:DNA replication protein DnaC
MIMKGRGHLMRTEQQESKTVTRGVLHKTLSVAPYKKRLCEICKGAGYLRADVPFGHPQFGKLISCRCKEAEQAAQRRLQLYALSQLEALRDKRLSNFNFRVPGTQAAGLAARQFSTRPEGWLVLIGGHGCGKTHLAAGIANHCLDQGIVVLFSTTADLLDHLRSTFVPSATISYDQRFTQMRQAELLALDDLGVEQDTPWVREKLFQLLDSRYVRQLPTVITMNWNGLSSLEERLRSRLSDRSLVRKIELTQVGDYRLSENMASSRK